MFGNTAVRVYVIAALIPLTWWGARRMDLALVPPPVEIPDWTFADMPKQLGNWQGEDTELDSVIADRTGAKLDTIRDRVYRDDMGHAISMHTAMFDDPRDGVIHSPLTCYRAQGWERLSETRSIIGIDDKGELSIPISVSLWSQKGEKRLVAYWYQLGEHVLFHRTDLGLKVRWSLAGKPAWPALIKVMLDIPAGSNPTEQADAEAALLKFAEYVAKWENQPRHRNGKGMLGTQTGTASDKTDAPP
jgi:EpsI family protein